MPFASKVTQVDFNTISNSTASTCGLNYQDNTSISTTANLDSTYTLEVTHGDCGGSAPTATRYVWVSIDWDQSCSFEASEVTLIEGGIPVTTASKMSSIAITIPDTATLGATRMRVSVYEANYSDLADLPCNNLNSFFGEAEDYEIVVQNPMPAACMAAPTGITANNILPDSARILWDTLAGASAYRVWYKAAGTAGWTKVIKSTNQGRRTLSGLTPSTVYRYMVQARCGGSWGSLSAVSVFGTHATNCVSPPTGLSTAPVQGTQARMNWTKIPGTHVYKIRWRATGDTTWNMLTKDTVWAKNWVTGLDTSTSYEWQIRALCKSGPTIQNGNWSNLQSFTTGANAKSELQPATSIAGSEASMLLFPNPATSNAQLQLVLPQRAAVTIQVIDVVGKAQQTQQANYTEGTLILPLNLDALAAGTYMVRITGKGFGMHQLLVIQ